MIEYESKKGPTTRSSYVTARLGPLSTDAPSRTRAKQLIQQMVWDLPEDNEPVVRVDARNQLWVMWHDYYGWRYRTPSGSVTSMDTALDRDQATERMLRHIHQVNEANGLD